MPKVFAEYPSIHLMKQLSLRHRTMISIGILISIIIVWAFFFYLPLCQIIEKKQTDLLLLDREQKLSEQTQKNITFYRSANERLKQELYNLGKDPFFLLDGLSLLLQHAQECRLQCKKIKPMVTKNASLFTKELYTVHLCGLFEDTMMFLKNMDGLVAPVFISYIEVARADMGNVDVLLKLENIRYHVLLFDSVMTTSQDIESI